MAEGFVLNIPQEMINRLAIADEKIQHLAKTSEDAQTRIVSAFKSMAVNGVDEFIRRLDEAQKRLNALGSTPLGANMGAANTGAIDTLVQALQKLQASKTTINIQGLDTTGQATKSVVDDLNRLVSTLNKIEKLGGKNFFSGINQMGRETLKQMNQEARKMETTTRNLDEATRRYSTDAAELSKRIEEAREAQRKFNEEMKGRAMADGYDLKGAKGQAKTLNELKSYVASLKRTMGNLDPKSKLWKDLNKILQETNQKIRGIHKEMGLFSNASSKLKGIFEQLGRALSLAFSVSAIRGYVGKIFEVTAEFEMQQKALGAILQNQEDANRIWQQTVDLAVRSPFRVKELVGYTRQLAAYRIESNKLFETNKMLADVSAGLGVDMQRLILAFGQVKAASYLRGTELRQFTEAGIPMLEELAKHFTELEGRVYSVDEVFGMISKRQVEFKDVEQVFKNMTSEGGVFFEMQEKMSDTLKGSMSNLKDEIDLMLYEIGTSNSGVFKWFIDLAKKLVHNWKTVSMVITGVLGLFVSYQLYLTAMAIKTRTLSSATNFLSLALGKLMAAIKSMHAALGPTGWLVVGLGALASAFFLAPTGEETIDQRAEELKQELEQIAKEYERLAKIVSDISLEFNNAVETDNVKDQRMKLQELVNIASKEYHMQIVVDVEGLDEDNIIEEFEKIEAQIREAQTVAHGLQQIWEEKAVVVELKFTGEYESSGGFLLQSMTPKFEKTEKSLQSLEEEIISIYSKHYTSIKKKAQEEGIEMPDVYNQSLFQWLSEHDEWLDEATRHRLQVRNKAADNLVLALKNSIDLSQIEDPVNALNSTLGALIERGEIPTDAIGDYKMRFEDAFNVELAKVKADRVLEPWEEGINKLLQEMQRPISEWLDEDLMDDAEPKSKEEKAGQFVNLITPDSKESREKLTKSMKEIMDESKAIMTAYMVEGQGAWTKLDYLFAKKKYEQAEAVWTFLGGTEKEKNKSILDRLKERLSLIKEMNQEFEKLAKDMDDEASKSEVRRSFIESAKDIGLDISESAFDDEGAIKMLNDLLASSEYANNKYQKEIRKILDNFLVQEKVEGQQEKRDDLKSQVEELFDRNELTKQVKDLGLDEETAERLFGFDSLSLDGLKSELEVLRNAFYETGEDGVKAYESYIKKIEDMEVKSQRERIKKYSEYLLKGMDDSVRLKIEELRKLKELEESTEFNTQQKERIASQIRKEAGAEQQKLQWKDFKSSEMYTMMFEDIEHYGTEALVVVQKKLEELKGSLKDLPASEVKEIVSQINKIQDQTIARNPFSSLRDAMEDIKALEDAGKDEESLQKAFAEAEVKRQAYQDELDAVNLILNAQNEAQLLLETSVEWQKKNAFYLGMSKEALEGEAKILRDNIEKQEGSATDISEDLKAYATARKSLEAVGQEWESIRSLSQNAWESSKAILESLGVESDSLAVTLGDTAMNMIDLVFQAVMFDMQLKLLTAQAKLLNVEMNTALGPIGWVVLALQAIATLLSAIFSAKDKALQKEVDKQLESVERLQEKYDELQDKLDEMWSTASIQAYNKELRNTTQQMIVAQEAAIAAQEQRKGANKEGSDNWNELQDMKAELKELEVQLEDSLAESFSKVTDGILDSSHDAAREFTDAWWDAFVEAGDGLSGLEENFNEMFLNLAKNQAAMQITGAFAERWKKDLEKYINADDTELTKDEAKKWAEEVRRTMPELSEALEGYLGTFKDMATADGSGLSALTKGIQGVSESTAQVLESLLNSMRFYVADSNAKLTQLLNNMMGGETESPMLAELRAQTKWMRDIYNLINGMTATHPSGGRGIKTVM